MKSPYFQGQDGFEALLEIKRECAYGEASRAIADWLESQMVDSIKASPNMFEIDGEWLQERIQRIKEMKWRD
jgi:hypothetical protein